MKALLILITLNLVSCSTQKSSSIKSMLLTRDCNPDSARFSGKDYVQRYQQSNSVAFDHCSKADAMDKGPYKFMKDQTNKSSNALMHKCEITINGKNYAASNKIRKNAKDRVIKKCFSYEKDRNCSKVKCTDL